MQGMEQRGQPRWGLALTFAQHLKGDGIETHLPCWKGLSFFPTPAGVMRSPYGKGLQHGKDIPNLAHHPLPYGKKGSNPIQGHGCGHGKSSPIQEGGSATASAGTDSFRAASPPVESLGRGEGGVWGGGGETFSRRVPLSLPKHLTTSTPLAVRHRRLQSA